jgi:hypothetical protein
MQKGVMEKMAPNASDVPAAPGALPGGVPAPGADPTKAPLAPAPEGSKSGEVPK